MPTKALLLKTAQAMSGDSYKNNKKNNYNNNFNDTKTISDEDLHFFKHNSNRIL